MMAKMSFYLEYLGILFIKQLSTRNLLGYISRQNLEHSMVLSGQKNMPYGILDTLRCCIDSLCC